MTWETMDTAPLDGTIVNVVGRYLDADAGFPRYAGFGEFDGVEGWYEFSRNYPVRIICWAWRPRGEWPYRNPIEWPEQ